jgi:hypothetical protein
MAALVIAWQTIHDAHSELMRHDEENGEPVGTGVCVDCGREFPCGPYQMAAQKLRDSARHRVERVAS